jgi:hypothetical protein
MKNGNVNALTEVFNLHRIHKYIPCSLLGPTLLDTQLAKLNRKRGNYYLEKGQGN